VAGLKVGTVWHQRKLSSIQMSFRLMPETGSAFPSYQAGQYIALRRDDCRLTRKAGVGADGRPIFEPDVDESGRQTIGSVTHPYSIASAPWETLEHGFIELYITRDMGAHGLSGRLSEALFAMAPATSGVLTYVDRITGTFTLDHRASEFENVVMVATGTGLAPFISMVKQRHVETAGASRDGRRYTLFHTNRTYEELGYHNELLEIEAAGRLDFVYVPTVSRPTGRDLADPHLGQGRANNVVRLVLGLPTKEAEAAQAAEAVRPVLPRHVSASMLRDRFDPVRTVLLACGNPISTADIKLTAERHQIRFETEEW
jgi:ferredoxin-NADP reductase